MSQAGEVGKNGGQIALNQSGQTPNMAWSTGAAPGRDGSVKSTGE